MAKIRKKIKASKKVVRKKYRGRRPGNKSKQSKVKKLIRLARSQKLKNKKR